jgi:hypothetical protein
VRGEPLRGSPVSFSGAPSFLIVFTLFIRVGDAEKPIENQRLTPVLGGPILTFFRLTLTFFRLTLTFFRCYPQS